MVGRQTPRHHERPRLTIVPPDQIPAATPTPTDDIVRLYQTCLDLREICVHEHGKGISAVQVGIPWDLFVVSGLPARFGGSYGYFIGCTYNPVESFDGIAEKIESLEGCLSLRRPDRSIRTFRVPRHAKVRMTGRRLVDTPSLELIEFDQVLDQDSDSIVMQHEIDHAAGVLISDIGIEVHVWKSPY